MKKFIPTFCFLLLLLVISGCGGVRLGHQLRMMGALPLQHDENRLSTLTGRCMLNITHNSKVAHVNYIPVQLTAAVTADKENGWQIDKFSAENILRPILFGQRSGVKVILIDPGHGGHDSGAVSASGIKEKDLNLQLSLLLAKELRKHGFTVYLTRQDDRFLTLDERPALVAKYKADLFISIHHNAAANTNAFGHEVFVINAANAKEAELLKNSVYTAFRVEEELNLFSPHSRGVKLARFKVQQLAGVPSILVEAGFMSNVEEVKKLSMPAYQQKVASAIAEAVAQ